jgi:hypothetical protein
VQVWGAFIDNEQVRSFGSFFLGGIGRDLDAVLSIATKELLSALLAGVGTEVGRVGYVAIMRAKDCLPAPPPIPIRARQAAGFGASRRRFSGGATV